jgi:hypothetical protein
MQVVRLQRDHLVQANFAAVYSGEKLDGDRDFESARHGEEVGFVESDAAAGFYVDRCQADFAIGDFGEAGDFVLEAVFG